MRIPLYQVDAFTDEVFRGNPAAVCPLASWLSDDLMQSIAAENNLSETAFFVANGKDYKIRWFTPVAEVDLCGHATLASAHVLFNHLNHSGSNIRFHSKSGELNANKSDQLLTLDFPAQPPELCDAPAALLSGLGLKPQQCLQAEDYIAVLASEEAVLNCSPDFEQLKQLGLRGVIITAAATKYDFVVRFFGPKLGIDEDPVTGSAFTQLAPYWANQLQRPSLSAKQVSSRSGIVNCSLQDDRVNISGKAVTYLQGHIDLRNYAVL